MYPKPNIQGRLSLLIEDHQPRLEHTFRINHTQSSRGLTKFAEVRGRVYESDSRYTMEERRLVLVGMRILFAGDFNAALATPAAKRDLQEVSFIGRCTFLSNTRGVYREVTEGRVVDTSWYPYVTVHPSTEESYPFDDVQRHTGRGFAAPSSSTTQRLEIVLQAGHEPLHRVSTFTFESNLTSDVPMVRIRPRVSR